MSMVRPTTRNFDDGITVQDWLSHPRAVWTTSSPPGRHLVSQGFETIWRGALNATRRNVAYLSGYKTAASSLALLRENKVR